MMIDDDDDVDDVDDDALLLPSLWIKKTHQKNKYF